MPPDTRKLGPGAKRRLAEADAMGASVDAPVRALVRLDGELDASRRAALEQRGIEIGSAAGDVVTLGAPLAAVVALTELGFVLYIELSRPLSPESDVEGG